jgi:3-hydroxyisobutyrate dehydrogenase
MQITFTNNIYIIHMKAFLGIGLLGSNFVKAMRQKREEVNVWNRTKSRADALEPFGAKVFESITEAVKGVDIIHLTLKDDAAVNEVLEQASAGFKPGAIIIDHTTTSTSGAIERTRDWKAHGITYLHAPVFMGPPNALEGSGNMLVSGDQYVITRVSPELSKMTGKLINLGPEEGKAASIKLIGNSFLIGMTAGIIDMLGVAKSLGVPTDDVNELFASWNPGAMMPARLKKISQGKFDQPSWELQMARKDAGLMLAAADEANIQLAGLPAIAGVMDKWIAKGFGNSDWTVISSDNV